MLCDWSTGVRARDHTTGYTAGGETVESVEKTGCETLYALSTTRRVLRPLP